MRVIVRSAASGTSTAIRCLQSVTRCRTIPAASAADFVLGDRDGTTCDPAFTRLVADAARAFGYSVAINDPYKGVEIVRKHGRPAENRHSLQVEIKRTLYMDEGDAGAQRRVYAAGRAPDAAGGDPRGLCAQKAPDPAVNGRRLRVSRWWDAEARIAGQGGDWPDHLTRSRCAANVSASALAVLEN